MEGWAKKWALGCENVAGKLRQKWRAVTAGKKTPNLGHTYSPILVEGRIDACGGAVDIDVIFPRSHIRHSYWGASINDIRTNVAGGGWVAQRRW